MGYSHNYLYGTPNQTVGYVANGGTDDWFYGEQAQKDRVISFSPEIGTSTDGFWPTQSRILPLVEGLVYSNLVIAAGGGADVTPAGISTVQANTVTASSVVVTWTTDEAANSVVEYGVSTGFGSMTHNAALVTGHSIALSGLTANTLYYYHVKSTDLAGNIAVSAKLYHPNRCVV